MVNTSYDAHTDLSKEMRKKAGVYLKFLRKKAGMTQLDVSKALGLAYYTFISQVENGNGRIPPHRYQPLANAFGLDAPTFTKEMMRYYDWFTYESLFGSHPDISSVEIEKYRQKQHLLTKDKSEDGDM